MNPNDLELLKSILSMLLAAGYGGKNRGTEKKHSKELERLITRLERENHNA